MEQLKCAQCPKKIGGDNQGAAYAYGTTFLCDTHLMKADPDHFRRVQSAQVELNRFKKTSMYRKRESLYL